MKQIELPKPLRGIIVPMVTPLRDTNTLDTAGLGRLVENVLAGGVCGVFILGTTGEGPSLGRRLCAEVVERTCQQVAGRAPVLVGITETSAADALELADFAKKAGAQAVVYAGPSYFPVSQEELFEHIRRMAQASPLPMFLYNMPSHTGIAFEVDTVRRAAELPQVAGFKDSSGNVLFFQKVCAALADRPEFTVLMGPEELLSSAVFSGGHGGVNGGSNLFPDLYVQLYRAAARHDIEETLRLQEIVLRVSAGIYRVGTYSSSYLKGLKCALSVAGICSDQMAEPYTAFGEAEREAIARSLSGVGWSVREPAKAR